MNNIMARTDKVEIQIKTTPTLYLLLELSPYTNFRGRSNGFLSNSVQ